MLVGELPTIHETALCQSLSHLIATMTTRKVVTLFGVVAL